MKYHRKIMKYLLTGW